MKKRFISPVQIGDQGMNLPDLVLAARHDPKSFMEKCEKAIGEGKMRLSQIDLKSTFEGLKGVQVPATYKDSDGKSRTITASAFPVLCGLLFVSELNGDDDYPQVPSIGDQLVTDIEDPKKTTVIVKLTTLNPAQDRVQEEEEFPEIGASEESYEIRHKRFGRRMRITREMIDENDTPNIIERVNALKRISNNYIERLTLDRVTDRYGSAGASVEPFTFRPRAGAVALFNETANNPGKRAPLGTRLRNNPLTVSSAPLENARMQLAAMVDTTGEPIDIDWSRAILLVPNALSTTAGKVLGSELEPGVLNEQNPFGPLGRYKPKLLSTAKLDVISASDWYLGDPKAQFRRKWKFRVEFVELGENTESYLRGRIAFQARVALDVEVGAVDYVYWIQNRAT